MVNICFQCEKSLQNVILHQINIFREFDHSANIEKQFCFFHKTNNCWLKVFDAYKKNNHFHEKKK